MRKKSVNKQVMQMDEAIIDKSWICIYIYTVNRVMHFLETGMMKDTQQDHILLCLELLFVVWAGEGEL